MAKGSSSALGDHRGLACPGCGVVVRSKDPFLWLERSGPDARAWHFDHHPLIAGKKKAA
jgi:hypothetical protein